MLTEFASQFIAVNALADYKKIDFTTFLRTHKLGIESVRYGKKFIVTVNINGGGFISCHKVTIDAKTGIVTSIVLEMGESELS